MEQLGQFLGRYQLVRVLGRGAMGVVYEGADPKLNRQVAVKTILKSQLLDEQLAAEYSARFIREAQAVARLNHPNIVTVFDFGNEADVAYLVMEFIRGKELKTYLDARHVFGIDEIVAIVCDLLEALDYAHKNGIVHRDIKPANVMLDQNNRVKLTDFGVARLTDGAGQEGTRAGTMVGTPSYMSPEQIKGLPAGAQTDLFACGVLLYQCLSLQKPFVGDSEWDIWQKIVNEDPPPLSNYRQAIPQLLESAVLKALAKNPKDRPATARAMIGELKAAIAGQVFDADATRIIGGAGAPGGRDDSASFTRGRTGTRAGSQQDAPDQTTAVELEFWRSIKDSGDAEEFHLYLQRFQNGTYADLARRKIAKLDGSISGGAPLERTVAGLAVPGQADAPRRAMAPADEPTRSLTRPPAPAVPDAQETRRYAPAADTRAGESGGGGGPAPAGRERLELPETDAGDAARQPAERDAPQRPRSTQGRPETRKKPAPPMLLGALAAVLAIAGVAYFMFASDAPIPVAPAASVTPPAPPVSAALAPAPATAAVPSEPATAAASATASAAASASASAALPALAAPAPPAGAAQSAAASAPKPEPVTRKANKAANADLASRPAESNQKRTTGGESAPVPAPPHATPELADDTANAGSKLLQTNPVKVKPPALKQEIPSFANSSSPQAARCHNIMQRAILGEPITVQEEADLRKGCK